MIEKNDTSTNERDIEGLLGHLVDGQQEYALLTSKSAHAYHAALIALLAERNSLKQRVAELEAHQPADRDLRERLLESALRVARDTMLTEAEANKLGRQAVWIVNGALDALRKGEQDAE